MTIWGSLNLTLLSDFTFKDVELNISSPSSSCFFMGLSKHKLSLVSVINDPLRWLTQGWTFFWKFLEEKDISPELIVYSGFKPGEAIIQSSRVTFRTFFSSLSTSFLFKILQNLPCFPSFLKSLSSLAQNSLVL